MSSSEEESSSGSSEYSEASSHDDDGKMAAMLDEWDAKEAAENEVFDSDDEDEDDDNEDDMAKRAALLKDASSSQEECADVTDEEESEEEESEEESEEEESEEEVSEESEESEEEEEEEEEEEVSEQEVDNEDSEEAAESAPTAVTTDDEDDDDEDLIDDGNIEDTLKKKPRRKKEKIKIAPIDAPSADDNEEDIAMKALLSEWGGADESDGDEDSDDDEDSEVSEREVQLEDNVIDHVVLAAPDLDEAMSQFEKMTGIGAVVAGSINGLGIKCARISFNDSSYIEIIAPDPKQQGPIGQLLKTKGIKELTPFHFAIRSSRAEELKEEVKQFGYVPDHITMFGGKKDGTPRKWEMLYLYGHKMGGICPFFINWSNSDHPCATLPVVGKLKKFTVRAAEDDPIHDLLAHVGVKGFNVDVGKPKMSFQFSSPEGTVKFATSKAVGFKFPGFDDEEHNLDEIASEEEFEFDQFESPDLLVVNDEEHEELPPPAY